MSPLLTYEQNLLIAVLLRIAVMAAFVSLVLGFGFMIDLLMRRSVTVMARLKAASLLAFVFVAGVAVRRIGLQGWSLDVSLEGALFAGFFGGVWVGTGVGAAIGAVCYAFGETLALPFYAAAGFTSGLLVTLLSVRGEIWSFSLNPFFIIYNFVERLSKRRLDRAFLPFAVCIVFAFARYAILRRYPVLLFGVLPTSGLFLAIDLVVIVYTLGIALKMAANARVEILLREEERALIRARLATLRSQINPHFLFNTLNAISALIRTDSEKAREMTRRLASIFRKSLEEQGETHELREELDFIDDYLSIECVRFGDEKLRIVKEIEPASLDAPVPTMILQPLVENAVKHGISRRAEGGVIRIAARRSGDGIEIDLENDGPIADAFPLGEIQTRGMGLRNVIERLSVYGGGAERFRMEPRPAGGALVHLFIPGLSERSVER